MKLWALNFDSVSQHCIIHARIYKIFYTNIHMNLLVARGKNRKREYQFYGKEGNVRTRRKKNSCLFGFLCPARSRKTERSTSYLQLRTMHPFMLSTQSLWCYLISRHRVAAATVAVFIARYRWNTICFIVGLSTAQRSTLSFGEKANETHFPLCTWTND